MMDLLLKIAFIGFLIQTLHFDLNLYKTQIICSLKGKFSSGTEF